MARLADLLVRFYWRWARPRDRTPRRCHARTHKNGLQISVQCAAGVSLIGRTPPQDEMEQSREADYHIWSGVVPHTGIAASVRRVPTEYGCYGGLRPAPVGPDRLEGTNEGTGTADGFGAPWRRRRSDCTYTSAPSR
jgi:hypothetical protein